MQDKPLQRIAEAETRDEGDDADLYDRVSARYGEAQVLSEEERQKILMTRSRLTAWFGS
jgi:hypothetical protein